MAQTMFLETASKADSNNVLTKFDTEAENIICRVDKIEMPAEDVAVIYLKPLESHGLKFQAGQYIDILLNNGMRRSYSIANAPYDNEFVQLHIRRVPGGNFSDAVFTQLHEGAVLRLEGPKGNFYVREDNDQPIILLASGTGFAPTKAILEHLFHLGIKRPLTFYWGAYSLQNLYMLSLPQKWEQEHSNFAFIPVLSDPLPTDHWHGRTGLLPQAILNDYADLENYQVYACGSHLMVEAAYQACSTQRRLSAGNFFSDSAILPITNKSNTIQS